MDSVHNSTHFNYNDTPWFLLECTLDLDRDKRRIALFLLYLLLFMAGLMENCLVVWVNWKRRQSPCAVLFCMLNISFSDLMVVLTMPFYMMEVTIDQVWVWGSFLCKFTHLAYVVNLYSSSFFLAYMTLERYLAVTRPESRTWGPAERRRRWLACGGLWALSLVLALLENVHVKLLGWEEPGCYMLPEHNYAEWYAVVTCLGLLFQFLGPATIIVSCNLLIARTVAVAPGVQSHRDVWLVHVYSLVFVLCWLPYHLVMFLMMLQDLEPDLFSCNTVDVLYFSYSFVQCISFFHCVANPILYNFLSKSFRSVFINTLLGYLPPGEEAGAAGKGRRTSNSSTSHSVVSP